MLQYAFGNCRPFASYEIPVDETTGLPIPEECNKRNFLQLYTTPEVASAFEHFWQNTNGLQDKFMDFWKVVATKFANNSNVLGYDIFNEPFTANTYKDSSLFYDQNKFDRTVLHQFYMRAHEVIRTVDPDHFIFFEPAQFPDTIPLFGGLIEKIGFESMPQNSALDEHIYCCLLEPGICDNGDIPADRIDACKVFDSRKMKARRSDADRLKVPMMISEWGACSGSQECYKYMVNTQDIMDEYAASHIYWQMKGFGDFTTVSTYVQGIYDDQGKVQPLKEKALSRTYVQSYQGIPKGTFFDNESGDFSARFIPFDNEEKVSSNILYLHKDLFYSNDFYFSATQLKNDMPIKFELVPLRNNLLKVNLFDYLPNEEVMITLTPKLVQLRGEMLNPDYSVYYDIVTKHDTQEDI